MDIARSAAEKPLYANVPDVRVAGLSLEQQGLQQAGTTGVGQPTTQAGIGSVLQAQQGPNISQFYNPYQSYVLDEINRQACYGTKSIICTSCSIRCIWWW
jgi:hypothetical protein